MFCWILTGLLLVQQLGAQTINEPSSQRMEINLGDKIRMKATLDMAAGIECTWEMPWELNGGTRNVKLTMGKTDGPTVDQDIRGPTGSRLGNWTYRWYGGCNCDQSAGCDINQGCTECGLEIDNAINEDSGTWFFNKAQVEVVVRAKPEFGIGSKPADTLTAQINEGESYAQEQDIICEAINTRPIPDVIFYLDNYELPSANISRVNITASDPPETGGLNADDLKDPDFMFSVRDTYKYRAQTTDDGKIFRCEYTSNAYTDEDIRTGVNRDTINITVQAPPPKEEEDINMDGFDGGKIGDELTLSIEFNANPGPDEIKWYMHDMDKPLGVEQDQIDDIVNTKSIASTCPECEQNINSTRYRWGQLTRNGNKYTTRLIITELTKSDRDQTGHVYVHNQRGSANYTYTLSNLKGGLSTTAIILIIVGCVVGVALIGGVLFVLLKPKKKGKGNIRSSSGANFQPNHPQPQPRSSENIHDGSIEMEAPYQQQHHQQTDEESGVTNPALVVED